MRAIPRSDHQEPSVQLPSAGGEPLRRRTGSPERSDLQRELDAAGLCAAASCPRAGRSSRRGDRSHTGIARFDAADRRPAMTQTRLRTTAALAIAALVWATVSGCGWRGVNSLPLPGTEGHGPGAFEVQAQLPDVTTVLQNSRGRVGDVNVGTVTKIERQGW